MDRVRVKFGAQEDFSGQISVGNKKKNKAQLKAKEKKLVKGKGQDGVCGS